MSEDKIIAYTVVTSGGDGSYNTRYFSNEEIAQDFFDNLEKKNPEYLACDSVGTFAYSNIINRKIEFNDNGWPIY